MITITIKFPGQNGSAKNSNTGNSKERKSSVNNNDKNNIQNWQSQLHRKCGNQTIRHSKVL